MALPAGLRAASGLSFHVLHAGSYRVGGPGHLRWELFVRRPAADVGDGVLMPAGRAIAGLWDPAGDRYLALSRPFLVRARAVVEAPFTTSSGSDVFARLDWRQRVGSSEHAAATVWIDLAGRRFDPEHVVGVGWHSYAVWYGLPAGPAELRADTESSYARLPLHLQAGRIERVTTDFRAKASLEVEVGLPGEPQESGTLVLRELPSRRTAGRRVVVPDEARQRFDGLAAGDYEVTLEVRLGDLARTVRLAPADLGQLSIGAREIVLHGTVRCGDSGCPATLAFTTIGGRELATRADARGRYELLLLEPVRAVAITAGEEGTEPWRESFEPHLEESAERDFALPD